MKVYNVIPETQKLVSRSISCCELSKASISSLLAWSRFFMLSLAALREATKSSSDSKHELSKLFMREGDGEPPASKLAFLRGDSDIRFSLCSQLVYLFFEPNWPLVLVRLFLSFFLSFSQKFQSEKTAKRKTTHTHTHTHECTDLNGGVRFVAVVLVTACIGWIFWVTLSLEHQLKIHHAIVYVCICRTRTQKFQQQIKYIIFLSHTLQWRR